MMKFLVKHFVKDYEQSKNEHVRESYGKLTSMVGIIANIFLFAGKFLVGAIMGSVSITADAVNNLSDAGSSIISLVSFKLSSRPADEEHPYGHARYEYIASMIVAILILMLGFELIRSSFDKIVNPQAIDFNYLSVAILSISILVKLWMYSYNKYYAKLLQSSIMDATAADSISDVMATSAVLLSTIISPLLNFNLDGYMGVVVAVFIMITGANIIKGTLDDLLGSSPSKEYVNEIINVIKGYDGVLGIHDLMIHNYGAQRIFGSVHVEVSASEDIFHSHDMIDNIERMLMKEMQIQMVIHMDPIDTEDEVNIAMRSQMKDIVQSIHHDLSIHDFRMVSGKTHSNLIFDCLVPYSVHLSNKEILAGIQEKIATMDTLYYLVVNFDRAYIANVEEYDN